MDAADRQALKEKIESEMAITRQKVAELKELTQPIAPENAIGRVSRMDAINNKSINDAALIQAKNKLSKLDYALSRIDHPQFGLCNRCGQPIPQQRLILMPQSARCVRCADR